jgi:hypothetical protein
MSCDITTGRLEPCLDATGGIAAVYFANYGTFDGIVFDAQNDSLITDLYTATPDVYKFDLKGGSTLEQTINSSRENGTTSITQTLTVMLKKQDAATHNQVKLLAYGRPHIIVEYEDGSAAVVGLYRGAELTGGTASLGANLQDANNYNLPFEAEELDFANFLDGAVKGDPFAGLTNKPNVTTG